MNKGLLTIVSLIILCQQSFGQQNIQFTQYIFNSLSVNPAYAGYKEEWFAQIGLRSQWTGLTGAPKTGTVSIDGVLDQHDRRHGVGLQITGDQLGAQSAYSAYANYALRLQLDRYDEQRLSLGVAAGVTQYGLDGNKLEYIDDNDDVIPLGKISTLRPDIRLGIYYSNTRWYAGVAVQDLFAGIDSEEDFQFEMNSIESIYRKIHGYFIAGAVFELERGLMLRPSILVKDDLKGPTSLDANATFIFNDKFWIGAGYRTRSRIFNRPYSSYSVNKLSSTNSINAIAQVYATSKLRIGYSYDLMLNRLSGVQNGTHEVTFGFTFGSQTRRQILSPRYF